MARSGRYILGPEVDAFEEEFAAYLGVRHCVGVANGTDALTIALRALGVGPDDEVVMPSFTFYATAEAALVLGARPVFCDIDLDTFCVTPGHRQGGAHAAHEGDRAGGPVRQRGADPRRCASWASRWWRTRRRRPEPTLDGDEGGRARRRGHVLLLPLEEPALPGRRGRDRDRRRRARGAACASCASTARRDKTTFTDVGYNSRLDELQAAVLRVLLPELDGWTERRRAVASAYERLGMGEHALLPAADRGRAARVPPLRGALGARAAGRARLLPHAGAPAAGDRGRHRAAGHRGGGPDQLRPSDGDRPRRGRSVRQVVEACASGST